MNATRPPLSASYSQNHTTLYVGPKGQLSADADAFVYCQYKKRTCRRDSFGHGVHTAVFNLGRVARKALCLRPPAGEMPFPPSRQGHAPQSPLRMDSEPFHWPSSMG